MGRKRIAGNSFDVRYMGLNPFANTLTIYCQDRTGTDRLLQINQSDGVVTDVKARVIMQTVHKVDREEFTKLYRVVANRKAIGKLSDRGLKLLVWIAYTIEPGDDYIVINEKRFKQETDCSHSTYLRAVNDLMDASMLGATRWPAVFWINPAYLFSGNRMLKFPDRVIHLNTVGGEDLL